jgi:hypothetical protein
MMVTTGISSRVSRVLNITQQFSPTERLLLAKLLLDSIVAHEIEGDADWQRLGLAAFEREWDNPDDAIYDNWSELYGILTG